MTSSRSSERVIPRHYRGSLSNYIIYLLHLAAYDFALDLAAGKRVLDYGCGSGFGTARLASGCEYVVGVDISATAIEFAETNYYAENLNFQVIDPSEKKPLPFADQAFDAVLSFQVIEHIRNPESYLSEARRVLKPDGVFLLATPDRSTRLFSFQKPWNMWHVIEYSEQSLADLLASQFGHVEILHMGGERQILGIELARTRRMKWLALPVTLPWLPENLRIAGLRFLKRIAGELRREETTYKDFGFDESVITISRNASPSPDLVAIARVSPASGETTS